MIEILFAKKKDIVAIFKIRINININTHRTIVRNLFYYMEYIIKFMCCIKITHISLFSNFVVIEKFVIVVTVINLLFH